MAKADMTITVDTGDLVQELRDTRKVIADLTAKLDKQPQTLDVISGSVIVIDGKKYKLECVLCTQRNDGTEYKLTLVHRRDPAPLNPNFGLYDWNYNDTLKQDY